MWCFTHVDWEGFSSWDLVMPLFMFMSGITIPFALSRYKDAKDKTLIYRRIFKRVVLLWIFGMMCQGNLLGLNPDRIYFYSNTLQAIAMGYLISALLYLHTSIRTQIVLFVLMLLGYLGAMEFITIQGYGGGDYTPDANLAEWIEREVLGRFRDGASVVDGQVVFPDWYRYTWILSSPNFGATVMSGLFAGYILKDKKWIPTKKLAYLIIIGISMVIIGWIWGIWHPVIKKIWTSSMVLVSSGYCFLFMALFYYIVDYKGWRKYLLWLKVYGMNSILAYMLAMCVNFSCIGRSLFHGLEQYLGAFYPILITLSNVGIVYFILWCLYKKQIFLRV
jgi:predicted acyltransferase